jgi:large subunit ribosomal protein L21
MAGDRVFSIPGVCGLSCPPILIALVTSHDGTRWERPDDARDFTSSRVRKEHHVVYAVVRAGGRQEKVEVGTIITVDRIKADSKGNIELAPVLLVDGDKVTAAAADLAKVTVTAEVLGDLRGPKVIIQKFKNKTGYKKRQGFRADLTRVKVTKIA